MTNKRAADEPLPGTASQRARLTLDLLDNPNLLALAIQQTRHGFDIRTIFKAAEKLRDRFFYADLTNRYPELDFAYGGPDGSLPNLDDVNNEICSECNHPMDDDFISNDVHTNHDPILPKCQASFEESSHWIHYSCLIKRFEANQNNCPFDGCNKPFTSLACRIRSKTNYKVLEEIILRPTEDDVQDAAPRYVLDESIGAGDPDDPLPELPDGSTNCLVCLANEGDPGDQFILLKCQPIFANCRHWCHLECIKKWWLIDQRCPYRCEADPIFATNINSLTEYDLHKIEVVSDDDDASDDFHLYHRYSELDFNYRGPDGEVLVINRSSNPKCSKCGYGMHDDSFDDIPVLPKCQASFQESSHWIHYDCLIRHLRENHNYCPVEECNKLLTSVACDIKSEIEFFVLEDIRLHPTEDDVQDDGNVEGDDAVDDAVDDASFTSADYALFD